MKYNAIKRRILKILVNKDMETTKKYNHLRKLYFKLLSKRVPSADNSNQEKVQKALFTIKKIYLDEESPILAKQLLSNGDITKTADFILFLEKIINEEE